MGEKTAGRKWINYEIEKAWNANKGLLGIRIHNLKDKNGAQSSLGDNPFDRFTLNDGTKKLSSVVKLKNPPQSSSQGVYAHIADNITSWIEEAIKIRNSY